MIVEEASEKDWDELYNLNKIWITEGISPYALDETKKEFFETLKQSSVYSAIINDKIIGFLICRIRKAGEGERIHNVKKGEEYADLDSVYVRKEYRSKGVGNALLSKCINDVKKAGYKRIIVSADSKELNKLVKFYGKHGFKMLFTRMMLEFK